jgi:DNA-binding MarR family transcriptional regulator
MINGHEDPHERLIQTAMWRGRRLTTVNTLYAQAAADRLGINLTDLLCLGILAGAGAVTAGQLAILIGLTSGAITGLVDRLEAQGLVRRERDTRDRRRGLIHFNKERQSDISAVFAPMQQALAESYAAYSDDELRAITKWLDRTLPLMQQATQDLRDETHAPHPDAKEPVTA